MPSRLRRLDAASILTPSRVSMLLLVAMLIAIGVAMTNMSEFFLNTDNLLSALRLASVTGIIALGMTLVILTGGIDLSVGSTVALSSVVIGILVGHGVPVGVAAVAAVLVGALCGLINAGLIVGLRIPPIVATLATLAVFAGVALGISGGKAYQVPGSIDWLGNGNLLGLPVPFVVMLAVFGLLWVVLQATSTGERIFAFGTNREAARYAAIKVDRLEGSLYVLSGALSGLGAVLFVAQVASAKANFGQGFELTAVTIVVLGGTLLTGGRGSLFGTVLAVSIIAALTNGLSLAFVGPEIQSMYIGAALILTAALYQRLPDLLSRLGTSDRSLDGTRAA
jgi:ribose/xylose/arabinose/galactoside ABC-type transport system permease subunit